MKHQASDELNISSLVPPIRILGRSLNMSRPRIRVEASIESLPALLLRFGRKMEGVRPASLPGFLRASIESESVYRVVCIFISAGERPADDPLFIISSVERC